MRRRFAFAFLAVVSFVVAFAFVPTPASGAEGWLRPVAGRVVRPFQAPLTRFGRGHLGTDFAAAPGTPVRAAGAGTVVFAGTVAHVRHVVVAHAGGLRTSYSFLAEIRVRVGAVVDRSAVVGTAGGRGENHAGEVVHLGLRVGDTFVDPMRLFAVGAPVVRVHLVPLAAAGLSEAVGRGPESRALETGLARPHPVVLTDPGASATPVRARVAACKGWAAPWCRWVAGPPIRPG